MHRNHNIVLVSHCFFNQNCVVACEARLQDDLLSLLFGKFKNDTSFIQMKCPELEVLGLQRLAVGHNDLNNDAYLSFCEAYTDELIDTILQYQHKNCRITAIVGIKGSPSCGISQTCESFFDENKIKQFKTISSQGVFMKCLQKKLKENKISIPFIELD